MTIIDTAFSDSYIKAGDPLNFAKVIKISSHAGKHDDLVHFLQIAHRSL
jgi:clathrin heavy chain